MRLRLTRTYHAESAHRLTAGVPKGHHCTRLHGHRYELAFTWEGAVKDDGMIAEYSVLDAMVKPLINAIDHNDLNTLSHRVEYIEILTLQKRDPQADLVSENPTVENLVSWFVCQLDSHTRRKFAKRHGDASSGWPFRLVELEIKEDARSSCRWISPSI